MEYLRYKEVSIKYENRRFDLVAYDDQEIKRTDTSGFVHNSHGYRLRKILYRSPVDFKLIWDVLPLSPFYDWCTFLKHEQVQYL